MSTYNIRLEVMKSLENKVNGFVEQYLIPIEKIWQPTDFLQNSDNENFITETRRQDI